MRLTPLLLVVFLICHGSAAAQGVFVSLLPDTVEVGLGEEFDVQFTVTAKLTLVGRTQSEQEGPLFPAACPNRFHLFSVAADSTQASVAHVILCAGTRVAGPGVLYELRFRAKYENALTRLELLDGTTFYDGGPEVEPLTTFDARVLIGDVTSAPA